MAPRSRNNWLSLTDDELALLRYTCDLFFTQESPLYYIEQGGCEPGDFAETYHSLTAKQVVDPRSFRLTDSALNRLAPVTECDARIMVTREGSRSSIRDYYLLEEIAVQYREDQDTHQIGVDLDHEELIAEIMKGFSPRRSRGDFIEVTLTPGEYLVFAVLAQEVRGIEDPDRLSDSEIVTALADLGAEQAGPSDTGPTSGPLRSYFMRSSESLPSRNDERTVRDRPPDRSQENPDWQDHIARLEVKGVVHCDPTGAAHLRPAFELLAGGLNETDRTSFVRYDFVVDEWFIRETSFLPVEGSLFYLGPTPEGNIDIRELDATRLDLALRAAIGPLPPPAPEQRGSKKARDFLLKA